VAAAKVGVNPENLVTVAAWYENLLFGDAERAALALTEAATRLSERPGAVTVSHLPRSAR
jgi:alkylhydroperoxidase family enzyme